MAYFSQKSIDFIRRNPLDDAVINILAGSVRSSKTWTMIPKFVFGLNTFDVPGDRIIFGVSKETIYKNVLNELFNFVGTKNYSFNRQSGDLWINNVLWNVVGAKDEGSEKYIRGRTVGIAYGDELSLIPESFFSMMLTRMSPENARLYGTTNPDSPYHYLYKDYITDEKKLKSGYVWVEKYLLEDNLSLSPAKILQYQTSYKGVFHKRYILGLWVVAEGAIYKDCYNESLLYDDADIGKLDGPPVGLYQRGMSRKYIPIDYGTANPTVFLLVLDDGDTLWFDREDYYDSRDTDQSGGVQKTDAQHKDRLIAFMKTFGVEDAECIVDPSAASFKAELTQAGIWHCDADNEVIDGIRVVSTLMGKRKIRIHRRCVKLIAETETYSWNPRLQKIGEDEPLKVHDHAPDAMRYFCKTKIPEYRIAA